MDQHNEHGGQHGQSATYAKNSMSLTGAVSMGTGVMVGAGIFALTGQIAELAGTWFPLAFLAAAIVAGFSAYSYVVLSRAFPSAGGIAMFLEKAYGRGVVAASCSLLMYFSMVINESLVARTFATYSLHAFGSPSSDWLVPALGVGLLFIAFLINIQGNSFIQRLSLIMAFVKVAGVGALAAAGLWASGLHFESVTLAPTETSATRFLGAVALGVLAYKGFTTITNDGDEIVDPKRNIGRAIILSILICVVIYLLVSLAVGGNLPLQDIITARDFSLAAAARPAFGEAGVWITVAFAVAATISGVVASVFAVSRMLAMLTEMKLVPHSHFGMPGDVQRHTLVYTVVLAMVLTIFFDLSRIAALGAIFYIVMDMAVHWGILRHLKPRVAASTPILITALVMDGIVLVALIAVKAASDMVVLYAAVIGMAAIFLGEWLFLRFAKKDGE